MECFQDREAGAGEIAGRAGSLIFAAVLLQYLTAKGLAGLFDPGGIENFRFITKAEDPAEKHGGFVHIDGEDEVIIAVGEEHGILTEAVHDHVGQAPVEAELDGHFLSGEHMEPPGGVVV